MNENNGKLNNSNSTEKKPLYADVSLKELFAKEEVQNALEKCLNIPKLVIIKKVRKPYKSPDTGITTQKVEAVSGTSLADMVTANFTLVEIKIDPVKAINKTYRILECTLGLNANMNGKNFNGYSATGLKLLVTKIEKTEGE